MHKHNIEEVEWTDRAPHTHHYSTRTTVDFGHSHTVQGTTSPAENTIGHVHSYQGTTTFENGHVHHFSGHTGPPVHLANGTHYHEFSGTTTFDDGHTHHYSGKTSAG
ncbi:YmaF family protein [Fictibacillus gelatini]|uniref:YmaF family protein n=1 Tax=Fictibacillus gelatini TaxID=225985 RepID=UPI000423D2F2|nr:YmaF family protein [Fictibacillus gelatini]